MVPLKVAILGVPGVGKASLLGAMVQQWGIAPLTATELSGAHAVVGKIAVPDGSRQEVHLHTFYGCPDFRCLEIAMMRACDGLVFVADVHRERIPLAPAYLRQFLENAGRAEIDFSQTPTAMQYHRAELYPEFQQEDMDRFLKISTEHAPRFTTTSTGEDNALAAIQWVIRAAMERLQGLPEKVAS